MLSLLHFLEAHSVTTLICAALLYAWIAHDRRQAIRRQNEVLRWSRATNRTYRGET